MDPTSPAPSKGGFTLPGCVGLFVFVCIPVLALGLHNCVGHFACAIAPTPPFVEDPPPPHASPASGNFVVSSRHVVNNQGAPASQDRSGAFVTVGPAWEATPAPTTHCVFVHGFNTTAAQAVDYGNALLRMMSEALAAGEYRRLAFHTFLWRGDLGSSHYGASEIAAKTSAPSLLAFIHSLPRTGDHRVVVIAHSLGSEVVLEAANAARAQGTRKFLDALVLFQPAVSWERVATGEYVYVIPSHRPNFPERVVRGPLSGDLRPGLDLIGRVVVTQSNADSVLAYIRTSRRTHLGPQAVPNPLAALGVPVAYGPATLHPAIRLINLSPGNATGVTIGDHSALFGSEAIFGYLWTHALRESFSVGQ